MAMNEFRLSMVCWCSMVSTSRLETMPHADPMMYAQRHEPMRRKNVHHCISAMFCGVTSPYPTLVMVTMLQRKG